jgi:predicted aldo/keto reductase-like oxidoreductase
MGVVQLAYGFILSHSGVSTVLGGFSSAQQVEDTVTSAADVDSLSENLLMDVARFGTGCKLA